VRQGQRFWPAGDVNSLRLRAELKRRILLTEDDHLEVRDSLVKQAALLSEILSAILTAAKERDPATVFIIQNELTARASRIEDRYLSRELLRIAKELAPQRQPPLSVIPRGKERQP